MSIDLARLTGGLPCGHRARPFEERDREPVVAARNLELHPIDRGDADEWRSWERMDPDPTLVRVAVDGPEGAIVAHGALQTGMLRPPDGARHVSVLVLAAHRRKGIGGALLAALEEEARAAGVPRLLAGAGADEPDAMAFAGRHGYREIGRRIVSFVDVAAFDPARFAASLARARAGGVRLVALSDALGGRDAAARDDLWRAIWEAEREMWEDIPMATPLPQPPYERFRQLMVESGRLMADASVLAYDGGTIVGMTMTGRQQRGRGWTWMTGTARAHRGRGIAVALKVEALARAKAVGLRYMGTTNDEPNTAMRGINANLGYEMRPAHVELEKPLA